MNGRPVFFAADAPFDVFVDAAWDGADPLFMLALQDWDEKRFYELLFHEGFHTRQLVDPALKGNWENPALQSFFPIDHAEFYALGHLEQIILAEALRSTAPEDMIDRVARYRTVARHRRALLDPEMAACERGSEFHEGIATYVGLQGVEVLTGCSIAGEALRERLDQVFLDPAGWRNRGYGVGGTLAFLLDRIDPDWKRRVRSGSTLGGLVDEWIPVDGRWSLAEILEYYGYEGHRNEFAIRVDENRAGLAGLVREITGKDHVEIGIPAGWPKIGMNYNPKGIIRVSDRTILHRGFLKVFRDPRLFLSMNGRGALTELADRDLFRVRNILFAWPSSPRILWNGEEIPDVPSDGIFEEMRLEADGLILDLRDGVVRSRREHGRRITSIRF
ncbi:MAG: hypothetical protein JW958_03880 [Candidatus Eisenbacteria bacterium]|nr:hypothetical protein [Candidatus Eisenbacteria bacterium]